MEEKKTANASLEDKRIFFLLIGFVVVLSLVFIALEWTKSDVKIYDSINTDFLVEDELDVIQTTQDQPLPPPPSTPVVVEVLNVVNNNIETSSIEINTEEDKNKIVEINSPQAVVPLTEEDENIFVVVETMPAFPGGDGAFTKFLNNNLKYPLIAEKNRIKGRVICQFIVNIDGSIVDAVVVRSVDSNLDKEAIRVIKLMPKWSPGKQQGKFVRVKYTLPIIFAIQ